MWIFLALHLLPVDVMGERMWNEADVLPLARQAADARWLPNDWYLNEDAGYRFAFQRFAGPLVFRMLVTPCLRYTNASCGCFAQFASHRFWKFASGRFATGDG